jgi:hypothetical protein
VLNLYLFLAHVSVSAGTLHCDMDQRVAYARYYVRNVKSIYLKKVAELVRAFAVQRRFINIDRVLKYTKRVLVFKELKDGLNTEVLQLIHWLTAQIDTAQALNHTPGPAAPAAPADSP